MKLILGLVLVAIVIVLLMGALLLVLFGGCRAPAGPLGKDMR